MFLGLVLVFGLCFIACVCDGLLLLFVLLDVSVWVVVSREFCLNLRLVIRCC